jgi:hypothetical protein
LIQHGSLLLKRSPDAPELLGIAELTGVCVAAQRLTADFAERLGERLDVEFRPASPWRQTIDRATRLVREKYSRPTWNQRR